MANTIVQVPQGDFVTTTLNGAISSTATSATIGTGLNLDANGGYLQIDYDSTAAVGVTSGPETIVYTGYNTSTGAVTGITRGQAGTTGVAHSNGASVQAGTSALYFKDGTTLGYAERTSGDFTTTTVSSFVDVTNLSVTVTVPAGGRRVKITAWANNLQHSAATLGVLRDFAIREGSTSLAITTAVTASANANLRTPACAIYSTAATAGSHTYKVSIQQDTAGTLTLAANSTSPAFILVELI